MIVIADLNFNANLLPASNDCDLGTSTKVWNDIYAQNLNGVEIGSFPQFTDTTYSLATTATSGLMSADDKIKLYSIDSQKIINAGNLGSSYPTLDSLSTYLKDTYGNNFIVFFEAQNFTDGTPSGYFIALYNSAVSLYIRYILTNKRHDAGIINLGEIESKSFKIEPKTLTNINDTTLSGYKLLNAGNVSNLPTSSGWYECFFSGYLQIAVSYRGNSDTSRKVWMRTYINSAWMVWSNIAGSMVTLYASNGGVSNGTVTLSQPWNIFRKIYIRTWTNYDYYIAVFPCDSNTMYGNQISNFSFATPGSSSSGLTTYPICGSTIKITPQSDKTKLTISETHNNNDWVQKVVWIWGEF